MAGVQEDTIYKEILDHLNDGVYLTDRERQIQYWNKGAERITGYSREEVIGLRCRDNILNHINDDGESLCRSKCPLAATMEDGQDREARVIVHHKDGHRLPVMVKVSPIRNNQNEITGAVEIFHDNIRGERILERLAELERLAMLDPLTGLPNRRFLDDQLVALQAQFMRMQWHYGVIMIDIDNFKRVNDEHGHEVGDKVLQMVGRTLRFNSRSYDVVGRWGGEEFLALISNADQKLMREIAERYRVLVAESVLWEEDSAIGVTISLGTSMIGRDDTVEKVVQRADDHMYKSKQDGRNRVTAD